MKNIPTIKLSEFFKLFPPSHILGTTYSISLAFFESVVYPVINKTRLQRCVLLCDTLGFQRLTQEAAALRGASQGYMAVTVPSADSFHPKVWLMMNEEELALLVGSGNLTQSGFMENAELFDIIHINKHKKAPKHLFSDVNGFLKGLYRFWEGIQADSFLALTTLKEMTQLTESLARQLEENESEQIRFLSSLSGPLIDQLPETSTGNTLFIASPYFGGSVKAIAMLLDKFKPKQVKVFPGIHSGNRLDVRLSDIESLGKTTVHLLKTPKKNAFAHLKLYGLEDPKGTSWLFCGSANCTIGGLSGTNVEAGILRYVPGEMLCEYFDDEPETKLPEAMLEEPFLEGGKADWLHCWAIDLGTTIEVITSLAERTRMPLTNVHLSLRVGNKQFAASTISLFEEKCVERLPWNLFDQVAQTKNASPLLEINAIDNHGKEIRSAMFVDNYWILSSGPIHRSAWRASLVLLGGEGLPELADVASVFALALDLFDVSTIDKIEEEQKKSVLDGELTTRPAIKEKTALWPPIPASKIDLPTHVGSTLGHLYWSQKILERFLKPAREYGEIETRQAEPLTDGKEDDGNSDKQPVPRKLVKASEKIWREAEKSFNSLAARLNEFVPTAEVAPNIWPISVFVLLATLAVRKTVFRLSGDEAQIPRSNEILHQFTSMIFSHRAGTQGALPPLSEQLGHEFQTYPHPDLCAIVLAAFAYLRALGSEKNIREFYINKWLMFRNVAENSFSSIIDDPGHVERICESYLIDSNDGLTSEKITAGLFDIIGMGWEQQRGYCDLTILKNPLLDKSSPEIGNLSRHLRENLNAFLRRSDRKSSFIVVEPTLEYCIGDRCPNAFVTDPAIRPLRNLCPVICGSCGSVLIPKPLYNAFLEYDHA